MPIPLQDKPLNNTHGSLPPGAGPVRSVNGRGTGWYCQACVAFISPIWIRKNKTVFPACRECFINDLPAFKTDVIAAKEDEPDVALVDTIPKATETGPVHATSS